MLYFKTILLNNEMQARSRVQLLQRVQNQKQKTVKPYINRNLPLPVRRSDFKCQSSFCVSPRLWSREWEESIPWGPVSWTWLVKCVIICRSISSSCSWRWFCKWWLLWLKRQGSRSARLCKPVLVQKQSQKTRMDVAKYGQPEARPRSFRAWATFIGAVQDYKS